MTELYPYQVEAVERMFGTSGFLLGDEPGLGKTVQMVAELEKASPENVLIVAPKSARSVWEDHLAGIMPVLMLDGPSKARYADYRGGAVVVNYDALKLIDGLRDRVWDYVIADEAHSIKNRKAVRTRRLKQIKAEMRRALTGTPMINRPDDLWSILNWLDKKKWGSYWRFFNTYVESIDSGYGYKIVIGPKNTDALRDELAPIMVRRLKRDVLKDLPDKYYTFMKLEMSPVQSRSYAELKKNSLTWIEQQPEDRELPAPTVLAQLMRLRQFADAACEVHDCAKCNGYGYMGEDKCKRCNGSGIKVTMVEPSNKIEALMELIDDEQPTVVFSNFRQMIDLASSRLTHRGIEHFCLTGDTPGDSRGEIIKQFSRGEGRVFLAQLQAGGIGIDGLQNNCTRAVFLDRSYSPAMNGQAEDRLHRHGQKNAVQIIIMQSIGTIDMAVETKLERKRSWIKQIMSL